MATRALRNYAIVLILLFSASPVSANQLHQDQIEELSLSKQWRHLLHYHQVGLLSKDSSQVDDPDFFLSADGASNPLSELQATIKAFVSDPNVYGCNYPARYFWIKQTIPDLELQDLSCPDFEKFRDEISARDLTLIFPAAYLNSPSSMFGHTLMRIDSYTKRSDLLSYSINYAANADPNDNELVFSYKGLTGGYPGVFSVLPYHEKVKEYNYLEARDVWEYDLDIETEELDQFIRHVWEVKDTHFDYYFFTENCSYHLLTLLDAASERFDLSKHFKSNVIPADTVRVLNQEGIIQAAKFRPSMQTQLDHRLASSTQSVHSLALALVENHELSVASIIANTKAPQREQAQALELAVALARYRAKKDTNRTAYYNRRSIGLLSQRSKLKVENVFSKTPTPKVRDDEGHRSHRWMLRAGKNARGNYAGLDLRMSYHDFLDPPAGYLYGAQLEIINIKAKYYYDDEALELDQFRAIDIASLSPRNDFVKPISWFVSTGLDRFLYQRDELAPYLRAGPGLSYRLLNSPRTSLISSFMLSTRIVADNDYEKGHTVDSGPRIGLIYQSVSGSLHLDWSRHFKLSGAKLRHNDISLGFSSRLGKHQSLRIGTRYQESRTSDDFKIYDLSGEIAWGYYF
jgi:hypothetical protein